VVGEWNLERKEWRMEGSRKDRIYSLRERRK
jgi:hypothetical protein